MQKFKRLTPLTCSGDHRIPATMIAAMAWTIGLWEIRAEYFSYEEVSLEKHALCRHCALVAEQEYGAGIAPFLATVDDLAVVIKEEEALIRNARRAQTWQTRPQARRM